MFGFHDSVQRSAYPSNSQLLDLALQQGTSSLQSGSGNTGPELSEGGSSNRAFDSQESSDRRDFNSRRLASLIRPGGNRSMTTQKAGEFMLRGPQASPNVSSIHGRYQLSLL